MITNDLGKVLAQNPLAVAPFGDESRFAPDDPNRSRFYRWFTDPRERDLYPAEEHEQYSRSYVSVLHLATASNPDDVQGRAVVGRLLAASPEFAWLWAEHDVAWSPGPHRKSCIPRSAHELDCEELSAERGSQIMLVYTATPGATSKPSDRAMPTRRRGPRN